jgi:lipid II:glycine glycyltransferase (peptidoglycan interpeptide bridge formation enzyme)
LYQGDKVYERVSEKEWEEIILKSDNAYFFSSPTWAKIIEKSYDEYCTATRLYNVNGKSILIPMMEKNTYGKHVYGFKLFDSMPMGPGGLFSESEITTDDFRFLIDDIIGSRHILYLALPPFVNKFSPGKSTTKIKDKWNIKDEWNHTYILNLENKDFEDIWKNYKKRTRGAIRKAIKSGVEIRDGTSLDDFRAFYNIWSKASQNWEYQETHSFKFFHNLHKYGSPHVKLSLATKDNKTIAGLISLHYTKTIYHAFMAYKEEYGTFNPTRILFNDSIKQACQEEYKHIDFGSSGKLDGVRRIKEGFRAEKVETKKYLALSNVAKILQKINKSL